MIKRDPNLPDMNDCIVRRVYKLHCRNLAFGVYIGDGRFVGIRTKFGSRFLDTEYHWDWSEHFGTVRMAEDTGIDLPAGMPLKPRLGAVDKTTNRPVEFISLSKGGPGWYFVDTNEASTEIQAISVPNNALFKFMDEFKSDV